YDADDVAQDTFVRIMAGESLLTIRDPKSFLCTIAKRVMIDLFRRNALERAWLDMLSQLPPELSPSPELRQSQLELLQQIDAMLDGLNA
ncbi:sigma factor, partial [Klebsiella pneumoniae]